MMPTSAVRNFSRSTCARLGHEMLGLVEPALAAAGADARGGNRASMLSLLRWMTGAMMWLGRSPLSCDDIFAEIGLDHLDARGLQMRR